MATPLEDSDESSLFCSSIIPKRKTSNGTIHKYLKQEKLISSSVKQTNTKNHESEPSSFVQKFSEVGAESQNSSKCISGIPSKSNYFDNEKLKNNCPLCMKFYDNTSYTSHMKQCAKKKKLSTIELLHSIKEQKRKIIESKITNLPSKDEKVPEGGAVAEYDFALNFVTKLDSFESNAASTDVTEKHLPVFKELEKLSLNKKKNKIIKKSILKNRTQEERLRIVTEKAAIILLGDTRIEEAPKRNLQCHSWFKSTQLTNIQNRFFRLWSLCENEGISDWYVSELKNKLLIQKENSAAELEPYLPSENIQNVVSKLNLPNVSVSESWRKMINNEEFSDLKAVSKDKVTFHVHSLVLNVRCSQILKEDYIFVFKKFEISTILVFLEFVYCGTLNGLVKTDLYTLLNLAKNFNYEELIRILSALKSSIIENKERELNSSNTTPDLNFEELPTLDTKQMKSLVKKFEEPCYKDLLNPKTVNLTQTKQKFVISDEGDDSDTEKSFLSFLKQENKKEDEKENSKICDSLSEVETSIKQSKNAQILLNDSEEKSCMLPNVKNNFQTVASQSTTNYLDEEVPAKNEIHKEFIVLSSDSESKDDQEEKLSGENNIMENCDFEVPYFDPFENYDHFSDFSPVNTHSQSLISGLKLPPSVENDLNETLKADSPKVVSNDEIYTTPVSIRRFSRIESSAKKKLETRKKKKTNLGASRIIRKSLGLSISSPKVSSHKKSKNKAVKEKEWLKDLTKSIVTEISKSPMFRSSTPVQNKEFIEITPKTTRDIDLEEVVTPYPNYSGMGEALLKEHLGKYGLKKGLGKRKATKILKHIYEELHPIFNTETGKLLKKAERSISCKKKRNSKVSIGKKRKLSTEVKQRKAKNEEFECLTECDGLLDEISDDIENSNLSGIEDLSEVLTQTPSCNPQNIPSAMKIFLETNPDYHQKILLYEPIWIGDLQKKLKETFNKHFKLTDLMDYLDLKCITFRSESQKRNNEKKNEKKKKKSNKENK